MTGAGDGRNGAALSTRAFSRYGSGPLPHQTNIYSRCIPCSDWRQMYLKDVVKLHDELRDLLLIEVELCDVIYHTNIL